jgi:hypothetical protein
MHRRYKMMQEHACVNSYITGLYKCDVYPTCAWLYSWRAYTRAHDVGDRIVSPRNLTHVYMEAVQPHARQFLSSTQVYVPADCGAYPGQTRDGRGVPLADVRVERRGRDERLQDEPHAVPIDGKDSRISARIRVNARMHRRCHRAQRSRRIEDRPRTSAAVARRRPIAAHTMDIVVTDAVFHAPMFTWKADAYLNACAPKPHAVHADGKGSRASAHIRVRPNIQMRSAHGRPVRGVVTHARLADPLLYVARRLD